MAKDRSRIYLGDTAVLSEAIKLDVQHLIQRFVAAGPSTFQTFADVWKHERMGLVPLSSLADGRSTDFLDAVFAECINWMTMSKDARCRIGGLFALYTLFRTQPSSHAQLRIRVTLPSWEGICNAVRNLVGSGFSEAEVVFRRLVDGHAFCLSFNATGQVAALPMSVGDWSNLAQYQTVIAAFDEAEEELGHDIVQSHANITRDEVEDLYRTAPTLANRSDLLGPEILDAIERST